MGCGEEQASGECSVSRLEWTHTGRPIRNPQRDGGGEVGVRTKEEQGRGEAQLSGGPGCKKNSLTVLT